MKLRENEWPEMATLDCDPDQVVYDWGSRKEKKNILFESWGEIQS